MTVEEQKRTDPWYSREDLKAAAGGAIGRGLLCKDCGSLIPQFSDLSGNAESRIYALIRDGRKMMAMRELASLTGCDLSWAKVWVEHSGKPKVLDGWPCSFCGEALRSSEAKQCPHCMRDWHDESNILRLGTGEPWKEK